MKKRCILVNLGLLIFALAALVQASEFSGTAKIGWVFAD